MKVLVTGADGLLGSNLVRALVRQDFSVRVLLHPSSRSKTLEGLKVEKYTGDILVPSSVEKAINGCEGVFHGAASTALWPRRSPRDYAINIRGTQNMLDLAEKAGVRRFVHVGSASSFGYGTRENPGTEETPYKYRPLRLGYFDSKLEAQKVVLSRVRESPLEAVVVAPTFMMGPYDSGPSSGKLILKFLELQPKFYPPGGRNFVHVRDVARAMISAFQKGRSGQCYILGNQNMEMREFFDLLGPMAGLRCKRRPIPKALLLAAGLAGSAYGSLSGKIPDLTFEIAQSSSIHAYYSPAKAREDLGMEQTPIEVALEEALGWLKDNHYCMRSRVLPKTRAGRR